MSYQQSFSYVGTGLPLMCLAKGHTAVFCFLKILTLCLLNPDLFFYENSVDPDQLASDEAS